MESMIKAVVFDMDGVLIDSEIVYLQYELQALKKYYPHLTERDLYPTVGMSGSQYRVYMGELLGQDASDPAFLDWLHQMNAGCQVDYPAIMRPGLLELLKYLKERGMQLAVASSSSIDNIRQVLSECGILPMFDCVISGDQFQNSKPDPEIYLYTFACLGRRPEECLVVEDSTYGVTAGVRSGALVAALHDERFSFDQSAAQLHIESITDLIKLQYFN